MEIDMEIELKMVGIVIRYNIFSARMLVRHDADGKMYLYDILRTKKEASNPLE